MPRVAKYFALNASNVSQLSGYYFDGNVDENEDEDKDEADTNEFLYLLHSGCKRVISTLIEWFGSESMLFASLWQSIQSESEEYDEYNEEYNFYRADTEVISHAILSENLSNWAEIHKTRVAPEINDVVSSANKLADFFYGKVIPEIDEKVVNNMIIENKDIEVSELEDAGNDSVKHELSFSAKTFDLLTQLPNKQTHDFYLAHEEEFNNYVEKPFQELCRQAAEQLPNEIAKRINIPEEISKIHPSRKSYDLHFSVKESNSSTQSATLFIDIRDTTLLFGMFISENNPDKQRFIRNYQQDPVFKEVILQHTCLPSNCTLHSKKDLDRINRLGDWLKHLARQNSATKNIQASVHLSTKNVLECSIEQLSTQITQTFEGLFPLFLLATCDNLMLELRRYLTFRRVRPRSMASYQPSIPSTEPKAKPEDSLSQEDEKSSVSVSQYVEPSFTEICQYVRSQGLRISDNTLRRYHLALRTRKFVILLGISGMGKTWLTQTYADAVKAEYLLVPVAPNWNTNEDLLGYFNPIDKEYYHTAFSRFLEKAAEEYRQAQADERTPQPYHLVLDEMNLARVEYYFAKFLSTMEVRMREKVAWIELAPDEQVLLPPNFYFIGTVNVDEITHGFADKVYDRAQLIELETSRQDLEEHLGEVEYREILIQIWDAVHPVAPFAFRVLDEVKTYVKEAEALSVSWQDALDEQLLQKILPKLKGIDDRVGIALETFVELARENNFRLSHDKADKMLEKFNKHGFTSYF